MLLSQNLTLAPGTGSTIGAAETLPARPAARWANIHRYLRSLHRAQAPAEQGLGLTVLGLLAMVALVVALIGLAISGGGAGWIITVAIAAAVLLLAYLDPWGH